MNSVVSVHSVSTGKQMKADVDLPSLRDPCCGSGQPWCGGAEDSGREGTTRLPSCGSSGSRILGREHAPLPPSLASHSKAAGVNFPQQVSPWTHLRPAPVHLSEDPAQQAAALLDGKVLQ